MTEELQSPTQPVGENVTISETQDVVILIRNSQREQMHFVSDTIESSFSKLTDLLTTVFQASGERKRKTDASSVDSSATKVARLSHAGKVAEYVNHNHASTSVEERETYPLSDSASHEDVDDDSISIPDAHSLDNDIADLIEDHPKKDPKSDKTGVDEEILASLEAEWSIIEDQGVYPELAKIINNLYANKMQDDKIKEKLKKYPLPKNCNSVAVA